jgi:hypothetical protein
MTETIQKPVRERVARPASGTAWGTIRLMAGVSRGLEPKRIAISSIALVVGLVAGPRIAAAAEAAAGAQPPAPSRRATYAWQKTDTSLALLNDGQVVWKHVHDKADKPHFMVSLPDDTPLTRPWPKPADYKPRYDHPWRRGIWYAWKFIDGKNYWEQNPKGTQLLTADAKTNDDFSARIDLTLRYGPADGQPVREEVRGLVVRPPGEAGHYQIDWNSRFNALADAVTLGKNRYGSVTVRLDRFADNWHVLDPEENAWRKYHEPVGGWAVYQGPLGDERNEAWRSWLTQRILASLKPGVLIPAAAFSMPPSPRSRTTR